MAPKPPSKGGSSHTSGSSKGGGKTTRNKNQERVDQRKQEAAQQQKLDRELAQKQHKRALLQEKLHFYRTEAEKKKDLALPLELAYTYVPDAVGKPKKVSDLDTYWVERNLKFFNFVPGDFSAPAGSAPVGAAPTQNGVDEERLLPPPIVHAQGGGLKNSLPPPIVHAQGGGLNSPLNLQVRFWEQQSKSFSRLRELRFQVFWSNVVFGKNLLSAINSFLFYCPKPHDVDVEEEGSTFTTDRIKALFFVDTGGKNKTVVEGDEGLKKLTELRQQTVLHIFFTLVRLCRMSESPTEKIGEARFRSLMGQIWSLPRLLDFCALFGDANFSPVVSAVHAVVNATDFAVRYKPSIETFYVLMQTGLEKVKGHETGPGTIKIAGLEQPSAARGSSSSSSSSSSVPSVNAGALDLGNGEEDSWLFLHDCLAQLESVFTFFPSAFPRPTEKLAVYLDLYATAKSSGKGYIASRTRRVIVR